MKISFPIIVLLLFTVQCSFVYFEEPQPLNKKNLSEFPGKLQGKYKSISNEKTVFEVFSDYINLKTNDEGELKLVINDNVLVRKYKGSYYFNIKDKENMYWSIHIIDIEKKYLILKTTSLDEAKITKFSEITDIISLYSDTKNIKEYLLSPSLSEFNKLVREGMFEISDTLVKE